MKLTFGSYHKFGMLITLMLFIMLNLCCSVQGQCEGLTVYNGDTQINTSSVCIKIYYTTECKDFYRSFNQSQLPEVYPRSDPLTDSVQEPSFLGLNGLDNLNQLEDTIYPGLSITWKPPMSGASRKSCYGYLVVWYFKDSSDIWCRLFHMYNGSSLSHLELRYQYDVSLVQDKSDYTVKVYSMPPYGPEDKDNVKTFVQTQIRTSAAYDAGKPGLWSPFVTYKTYDNGTVSSSFSLPPAHFNITRFSVYLMKENELTTPVFQKNYTVERTEGITQFFFTTSATVSDFYRINVWAQDEFPLDEHICQCWSTDDYGVRYCKNTCGGTVTDWFYLNITEPSMPIPTTALLTSSTSMHTAAIQTTEILDSTPENNWDSTPENNWDSTPENNWDSTPENNSSKPEEAPGSDVPAAIIGGVVGASLLVIFIIFGVCLFRNKGQVKLFILDWSCLSPDLQKPKMVSDPEKMEIKPDSKIPQTLAVPRVSKKTVYIMSADDHEAHVELVNSFVVFLKAHCKCDVILPSDSDQFDITSYEWFLNSISRSDHLIFINSEGAEKLIEAYLNRSSYKNRIVGPEGDLFIFGLKHILVSEEVRDRTVALVSFSGNHCHKYLQIPKTYMLPKHLPQFLQKIHRLDSVKNYESVLPMNVPNISKLSEGAKLLAAIKYAKIYEENNPKWFESTFGELKSPKPVYERLLSADSAYPPSLPYDRLDSVSLQFSQSESPTTDPQAYPYSTTFPSQSQNQGVADSLRNNVSDVSGTKQSETDAYNPPDNLDDGFSCVTVAEVCDGKYKKPEQQHLHFDGSSIIPPETASQFTCGNYSAALSEINKGNNVPLRVTEKSIQQQHLHFDDSSIIPPETASQFTCGNYSTAFSEINKGNNIPLRLNEKSIQHQPLLNINDDFVIPPESTSQIVFDNHSTAMSEINRNEESFYQHFKPTASHISTDQHFQPTASNLNIDQHLQPERSSKNTDEHFQPSLNNNNTEQHLWSTAINKNIDNNHDCQSFEADDSLQRTIIPPDSPLDMQVDNVSIAFADINANSYNMLWQGAAKFLLVRENGNLEPEYDSVSI